MSPPPKEEKTMTDTTLTAGVIGLGAMGFQMARHMRAKGLKVVGYDISAEINAKAAELGVVIGSDVADVGRQADVVFVIVQTDKQVVDVIGAGGGLLAALKSGSVICIASSVAPETCREIEAEAAKKGVGVLDTPLILGQEAANNGTLTILSAARKARWKRPARRFRPSAKPSCASARAAPARSPRLPTTCCCGRASAPISKR